MPRPINEAGVEAEAMGRDPDSAIRPKPDREAAIERLRERRLERRSGTSGLAGLAQESDGQGKGADELSARARSARRATRTCR